MIRVNVDTNSQNVQPRQGNKQVLFTFTREDDSENPPINLPIFVSPNKIEWTICSKLNVVRSTSVNEVVQEIRLCEIYRPNPSFDSTIPHYYDGILKIEICCPISIPWIFDWISRRPVLNYVRFGAQFFYESECYEPHLIGKIRSSNQVKELVIKFDRVNFYLKTQTEQTLIKKKINVLLNYAATHFTGLERVDFTLPIGSQSNLDEFLAKSSKLKGKPDIHEEDQMVCYQSTAQVNTSNNEFSDKVNGRKRKLDVEIPGRRNESHPHLYDEIDLTVSTDEDDENRTGSPIANGRHRKKRTTCAHGIGRVGQTSPSLLE